MASDAPRGVLAVVPARGGSEGIPRKNLRLLAGQPLVSRAIATALASTRVDRVLCSTDDEEIASMARAAGAEVPFLRPPELATATAEDWPVFVHALRWYEEHEGWSPEIVVNLRPTSPLRRPEHVDDAIDLLLRTGADSVKSISPVRHHPHKMWVSHDDGTSMIEPFLKTPFRLERGPDVPRAELEPVFNQNGVVDVTRREVILDQRVMIGARVAGLVTSADESVDLDSAADLIFAEALLAHQAPPAEPS